MIEKHDLILVGTGFASTLFLMRYLATAPPTSRVLVLERGLVAPHPWQVEYRRNSSFQDKAHESHGSDKEWVYTIGFGGGSNCDEVACGGFEVGAHDRMARSVGSRVCLASDSDGGHPPRVFIIDPTAANSTSQERDRANQGERE